MDAKALRLLSWQIRTPNATFGKESLRQRSSQEEGKEEK